MCETENFNDQVLADSNLHRLRPLDTKVMTAEMPWPETSFEKSTSIATKNKKRIDVAKNTDRTAYDVRYNFRTEPSKISVLE